MADEQTAQDNRVSTVLGRKLGGELTRLRQSAGLTQGQAAKFITASTGKIAKMESGWVPMRDPDIRALCAAYGASEPETVGPLLELARLDRERRRAKGWWSDVPLSRMMKEYVSLENAATVIKTWQLSFIPGLLQVPGYVRTVRHAARPEEGADDVAQFVRSRMTRQQRLVAAPLLTLWAVVPEAALRYMSSQPVMMLAQLNHLVNMSQKPNVRIQVLPFTSGLFDGLTASFNLLSFAEPGSMDVAFAEQQLSQTWVEGGETVAQFTSLFAEVSERALDESESMSLIEAMSQEL